MARPLFVMFLSTSNQTIIHHVFLELCDIGFKNFQILSMLFSYLPVAFTRSLGLEDTTTCFCRSPEGNVLCFCLPASPFEISLADDRNEIVLFSFHEGGRNLKPRFRCNDVSAAVSTYAKKVAFSPSPALSVRISE